MNLWPPCCVRKIPDASPGSDPATINPLPILPATCQNPPPPFQTPPNAPGHANSRRYHRRLLQQEKDGSAWNLRHSHWRARGARGKKATGALAFSLRQELWLLNSPLLRDLWPSVWVGGGRHELLCPHTYPLCT